MNNPLKYTDPTGMFPDIGLTDNRELEKDSWHRMIGNKKEEMKLEQGTITIYLLILAQPIL